MKGQQKVYFEKQSIFSLQCGLYSVNNLLGQPAYSENSMKAICYELSDKFVNPHKHPFGGDYDVNVLMIALQRKGLKIQWFDKRQLAFKLQDSDTTKYLVGLLINVHSESSGILNKVFKISGRHWLAVRRLKDNYYWIDSKQQSTKIYSKIELQQYLNGLLQAGRNSEECPEILVVYR